MDREADAERDPVVPRRTDLRLSTAAHRYSAIVISTFQASASHERSSDSWPSMASAAAPTTIVP